jgi:dTDP-glucose pyrophosphorylase
MKRFLPNFRKSMIRADATLKDALRAISESGALMACLTGDDGRLQGIVTDSDVRKALLAGCDLNQLVSNWINYSPICANHALSEAELLALATSEGIREIPLIDDQERLVDIFVVMIRDHRIPEGVSSEDVPGAGTWGGLPVPNSMLLLAGGKGTRLRPVVNDRPKPLAEIGGRPILETIITRAANSGIRHFFVAVNYMGEKISEHLQQPCYDGIEFTVLQEHAVLGTAGSIGLIPRDLAEPLIVANADVLTSVNYNSLLEHHRQDRADITVVVRSEVTTVPYGVVQVENGRITGIHEKPVISHLVNAGIYVVSPDVARTVKGDSRLDMPDLIEQVLSAGGQVSPFYMHEYWVDIGRPDDFRRANDEYFEHFGSK